MRRPHLSALVLALAGLTGIAGIAGAALAQDPPPAPAEPTEAAAPADTAEAPPASIEEQIRELDQKLRVLTRQLELEREQAAEKAKTTPTVTASKDGLSFQSADGAYQLRLRGYVHADGRFFLGDDERPATDTWTIRRARPIFEGRLAKYIEFRIMPDFGGGTTVLQDAYGEVRPSKAFGVRAGKFKAPFGLERLQSATDILFVERALPTNLVPNRDIGVQVSGELAGGRVSYAAGAFNGVPDGGSADADTNDDKDFAARVFFQPFTAQTASPLRGLGLGVAVTTGEQTGAVAAPGLPVYRTPGQQTFFSYRTDGTAAGTAFADGDRTRISPQGYFYRGPFGVQAEAVRSTQEVRRGAVLADLSHDSWQVSASWVLTGEAASYRAVTPKKVFDPASHTWGAFELAARVSRLDVDDDAFPLFANPASSSESAAAWSLGLNWYLNKNARVVLDYEVTSFEGGRATGDREDEKILFSRLQIAF